MDFIHVVMDLKVWAVTPEVQMHFPKMSLRKTHHFDLFQGRN